MADKVALITGATGQDGTYLAEIPLANTDALGALRLLEAIRIPDMVVEQEWHNDGF